MQEQRTSMTAREATERYIRRARQAIASRNDHPTYGTTKSDIRLWLDMAEGTLRLAHVNEGSAMYVDTPNGPGWNDDLSKEIRALRDEVKGMR